MNRDDIIRMAREAGLHSAVLLHIYEGKEAALTDSEQDELRRIERFAALVAAHTLANIDPSTFMSYREGFEAGAAAERERLKQSIRHSLTIGPKTIQTRVYFGEEEVSIVKMPIEEVVAAEREACAKLCEDLIGTRAMAVHCADAIRAKEQA
jgi:hypothetical protein